VNRASSAQPGITTPEERLSFENGRIAGSIAAKQLTLEPPFTPSQLAWLNGFLAGLSTESASPSSAPPQRVPSVPPLPFAPEPTHPAVTPSDGVTTVEPAPGIPPDPAKPTGVGVPAPRDVPSIPPPPVESLAPPSERSESTVHLRATLANSRKAALEDLSAKYTSDNPFAARVQQVVPQPSRASAAWRVTIDVEGSGLRCRPGDCLGIVPSNDPDLVRKILRRLGAKGQETVTTARGTGPAWRALLEELDIVTVTRELLWLLANSTRNNHEATQLESLAAGPLTELNLQSVLRRFPGTRPSLNEFVNQLHPLVPQYFPLASARSRHADSLEFLAVKGVAETRSVVTALDQERLDEGDWLPVFVDSRPAGHPPVDVGAPVILMAPGAGVASAFAFLAERAATRGSGRNWLFTSPIGNEQHLTYQEHFSAWQTARVITRLDLAPADKLGLRLLEQAEMLQAWIVDGSYLYVYATQDDCRSIERALIHLLVTRARISPEDAEVRLQALRQRGQLRLQHID
jgi:sulfite reductase (NADPH) flavoprotein alpha-component